MRLYQFTPEMRNFTVNFYDSYIKIFPDKPSKVFDMSEGAAYAFIREKTNGNMEKARALGKRFAGELTAGRTGMAQFGVGAFDDQDTLAQRNVLFAFIVGRVIEEMAPNSIVAQSAMSAFYETIERTSPEIYRQISDSAALSLYIFSARSTPGDETAAGEVFARLCGREGDALFVAYGRELAGYFMDHCTREAICVKMIR